jgi:hypothetical protein
VYFFAFILLEQEPFGHELFLRGISGLIVPTSLTAESGMFSG